MRKPHAQVALAVASSIKVPPVPYYPSGRSVAQALAWLYRAVRECSSTFNKFELLAGRCAARRARKDGFFAGACR